MPITTICPSCGTELKAGDQMRGQTASCPQCGREVVMAQADARTLSAAQRDRREREALYDRIAPKAPPPDTTNAASTDDAADAGETEAASAYRELLDAANKRFSKARTPIPKPTISIGGIQLDSARLFMVGGGVILAILIVWQGVLYVRGEADTSRIVAIEPVNMYPAVVRLRPVDPAGDATQYTLGGQEKLMLTKSDKDGEYIVITLELSQDMFFTFARNTPRGFVLDTTLFELRGGNLDSVGELLAAEVPRGVTVDLASASGVSGWAIVPPEVTPTREENVSDSRATLIYSDAGASGRVTFRPNGAGISATGDLLINTVHSGQVEYVYEQDQMRIGWDKNYTGWRQARDYVEPVKRGVRGPRTLKLLFYRPTKAGQNNLSLFLGSQELMHLSRQEAAVATVGN